jgi:geranylgeranyl reductase family protein
VSGGPVLDAVVVGGGPAGSTMAALLKRAGATVTLCDATRFPRHKICGEYVPPAAIETFARLGVLAQVEAVSPLRHVGMAVVSPDGTKVLGRYGGESRGFALRRYDLDRILLDGARRAGATVLEETRVTGLEREAGGILAVRLQDGGTLRARAVVGADGRNSVVARRLDLRRREPRHRKWAVMGHFRDVETPGDHGEMIVTPYGYCGINPLPQGLANVCIVVDRADIRASAPGRARLAAFFHQRIAAHPLTRKRMARASLAAGLWATGPMACRASDCIADGVLLVGDAAGFYDPFTGEGIGMALRGAELAAGVLARALERGDVTRRTLAPYAAARRAAFRDRLRLDRVLQSVLRRPRLADWAARRLDRDRDLADLLARVAGDTVEARAVLGPGFMTRLLLA